MAEFTDKQIEEMSQIQEEFENKMEEKIDRLIQLENLINQLENDVQVFKRKELPYDEHTSSTSEDF